MGSFNWTTESFTWTTESSDRTSESSSWTTESSALTSKLSALITNVSAPTTDSSALTSPAAMPGANFGDTALFVANMIIVVFIFTFNIITIYLIVTNKTLRGQATNCFAISLSCADLMIGAIYPFFSVLNYTPCMDDLIALHYPCAMCLYFIMVSAGISQFTLLFIAMERYVAIMHPLDYRRYVSRSKIYLALGVVWSYTCLACLTMFVVLEHNRGYSLPCSLLNELPMWYYVGVVMPHIFIPKIISLVLYARILRVASKQEHQIHTELARAASPTTASRRERKAAKMTAILLGLFLICWLPYLIIYVIAYVLGPDAPSAVFDLLEFSKILSLSNSYMNPMVYFWKNRDFRQALTHFLRCKKERGGGTEGDAESVGGNSPNILIVQPKHSISSISQPHY